MKTTNFRDARPGRLIGIPAAMALMVSLGAWMGCGSSDAGGDFNPGNGGSGGGGDGGLCSQVPGATLCGGACVLQQSDPNNCGMCGKKCATGEVCSAGTCALNCGGGTTKCGSLCVDTKVDGANCGACGTACPSGQACSNGKCATNCSGGTSLCNGACVNTGNDTANCGTCGNACQSGQVCTAGKCDSKCAAPDENCGGKCVNTQTDLANCGACGTACQSGELCSGGKCGANCGGGTKACGTKCVDTQVDPANCGDCDKPCATGEFCSAGVCATGCTGTKLCSGKCVDTQIDNNNCGDCGTVCVQGEQCTAGACACQTGLTSCSGACVDTKVNDANCGTCGHACAATESCVNSICTTGTCGGGLQKCGLDCVNLQTDGTNCGQCGNTCTGGTSCQNGTCQACDSATTDCDGDGWKVADGDCCDKPGTCGSEPAKVNPGAIEVKGNAIDDNCNGKTDLFDMEDTVYCDGGLASNSAVPGDYAKALGICRTTTETPALLKDKTWGLISAKILRADGSPLGDAKAISIRDKFGGASPIPLEGQRVVVMSSGIAADATQTNPGPNGGAPAGYNVSTSHTPSSSVNIQTCSLPYCIKDWYAAPNLPLKNANALPDSPGCSTSDTPTANDSVMLVLRLRAPTNVRAFSFNSYFYSAEYPEYVCTSYNDQFITLVDTPSGVPSPIPNPKDKNLMTYSQGGQFWPIGINIAKGTNLFAICEPQGTSTCWDTDVSASSCSFPTGAAQLTGTGFESQSASSHCTIGGGTYWLTTAGNVIPGQIVEVRIAIWDVGDSAFDSLAVIDGFSWLASATLPGTGS
ncbi:MAG: choice-of-anchor L domain-containing protein [Deltaproteobacteria bacterium]|nr:choice-of-anchor L domain-containing protein [Deltaproteobacteria bacterium]